VSNLAFVFPALALMIALILLSWTQGRLRIPNASMLLIPGAALFALIYSYPLAQATGPIFEPGTEHLRDTFNTAAFAAAFYGKLPADVPPWQLNVLNIVWDVTLGLAGLALSFAVYHFVKRARAGVPLLTPPAVVVSGVVLVLALAVLILMHRWFGLAYPLYGSGIYLAFLFSLFVVLMFFGSELAPRYLRAAAGSAGMAVVMYWLAVPLAAMIR
jgi:hypothetical protein